MTANFATVNNQHHLVMDTRIIWVTIVAATLLGIAFNLIYRIGRESAHSRIHLLEIANDNNEADDDDDCDD